MAAVRKTMPTRFFTFFLPRPITFPLLMSLLGANPIQEAKWSSSSKRLMSVPTSEITVNAVMTLMPSMEVRSTPQIRFTSVFKLIRGSLSLGFLALFLFCTMLSGTAWNCAGFSSVRVGKLTR